LRDVALLPLRGAGGERATCGDGTDRKQISLARSDLPRTACTNLGALPEMNADDVEVGVCGRGQLNFFEVGESVVDRRKVFLDHGFAALAVSLS